MDLLQIVMFGIIGIIIVTITLAVLSYGAFKVRESRAPKRKGTGEGVSESLFFERIRFVGEHKGD